LYLDQQNIFSMSTLEKVQIPIFHLQLVIFSIFFFHHHSSLTFWMKIKSNLKITPYKISLNQSQSRIRDKKRKEKKIKKRKPQQTQIKNQSSYQRMKRRNSRRSKSNKQRRVNNYLRRLKHKSLLINHLILVICFSSKISNFKAFQLMIFSKIRLLQTVFSKLIDHKLSH
jgi:hypothetical protein